MRLKPLATSGGKERTRTHESSRSAAGAHADGLGPCMHAVRSGSFTETSDIVHSATAEQARPESRASAPGEERTQSRAEAARPRSVSQRVERDEVAGSVGEGNGGEGSGGEGSGEQDRGDAANAETARAGPGAGHEPKRDSSPPHTEHATSKWRTLKLRAPLFTTEFHAVCSQSMWRALWSA